MNASGKGWRAEPSNSGTMDDLLCCCKCQVKLLKYAVGLSEFEITLLFSKPERTKGHIRVGFAAQMEEEAVWVSLKASSTKENPDLLAHEGDVLHINFQAEQTPHVYYYKYFTGE